MKKALFIISLICYSLTGMTQEVEKQKEVDVTFRSLNSFGLTYKSGDINSKWRFNVVDLNLTNDDNSIDSNINKNSNFSIGLSIGREKIKKINEKFEFRYGADLGVTYSLFTREYNNKTMGYDEGKTTEKSLIPSFNLVLGVNYNVSNHVIIGAEIKPFISYRMNNFEKNVKSQESKYSNNTINAGLSNSSILMSIGYRF